ncbi:MAG: hypothetical protein UU08_C0014G0019 [Candidatus Uhrbacteria bacterium GW2011_GWE2_40_58]|nr:MAG: hypothetical protein UT94_C0013G0025 [Candidatus Uhrbacteria bacterium GW2011_GWF2_40_263]KKR67562.1 MAG: hypothetical protein UU08_C0014G0019 [Candidatus Uhrbacteria bacterium GW2011_GWE2_40_58]OGL93689.1 MAG: hypothetical protein A2239_00135 [Candidatus Uhrbacteria bacterium RIFOXYA2_FULL_40_9]OGL96478.1 MAG: hypothetical protein A2332_04845 [Candidatus Uhrbacteria bacterium RIFOXYB2_FULL_41_18]HBK34577.1 N-methyl-D-aspartate receptor NMDAR2C subunit [Candidatus Uhrbacteria bacterium]
MNLQARWNALCQTLHLHGDHGVTFQDLCFCYEEPHRHYHTLTHLLQGFEEIDRLGRETPRLSLIEYAYWFHDAIYVISNSDNELKSAKLACRVGKQAGLCEKDLDLIEQLILATIPSHESRTKEEKLIGDIDLSIFGQNEHFFEAYEQAIRKEYLCVPDALFNPGRAAILQQFLARKTIYHTPFFQQRYEEQARINLQRSLRRLQCTLASTMS